VKFRAFICVVIVAAVWVALPLSAGAQAPKPSAQPAGPAAPQPAQIDRNGVLILVRSTILALDQANKSGNYTVLRDLGAPGFQANNAARLAEIFASQRRDNLDLSGVAVIDPQLTILPQIEANGMMRMAGFFPSVPQQVNFEMLFAPVSGQWRLFGLSVNIGQSGPVAPQPAASAAPAPPAQLPAPSAAIPPQHGKPAASAGKPAAKQPQPHTDIKPE
jgi:cell division septation protein DedD